MSFSWYGFLVGLGVAIVLWQVENILKPKKGNTLWPGYLCVLFCTLAGARAYHLWTDWALYGSASPLELMAVWNGGLAIYGALLGGVTGLMIWKFLLRAPWSLTQLLDAFAISLPFGQAVGRWGNFANQELFGLPTYLPWAVFIDPSHRPTQFIESTHFHPLFLYESFALLLIGLGLHWIYQKGKNLQRWWPSLTLGSSWYLGLYLFSYGILRFSLEFLRIASAPGWLSLSIAQWWSLLAIFIGLFCLARPRPVQ